MESLRISLWNRSVRRVTLSLVAATVLVACGRGPRDPRPLAPPERAPAPWEAEAPPTLRNALLGKTSQPIRARVQRALLADGYAWLAVRDDDATDAWVVVPALAATPTQAVMLAEYSAIGGGDAPAVLGPIDRALLALDISGPDVALAPAGDDAVLDPLLPPLEVTALQQAPIDPIGPTIAALQDARDAWAGRTVQLRAQVWRVIPRVGGLDWAVVRDGSAPGSRGACLIATRQAIERGAIIDIQGTVTIDRRFGMGVAPLVLEPARIVATGLAAEATPTAAPPPRAAPPARQ